MEINTRATKRNSKENTLSIIARGQNKFAPEIGLPFKHSDSALLEIGMSVMGHSLMRTLVCLLRTARFNRALFFAHSFALLFSLIRSLAH